MQSAAHNAVRGRSVIHSTERGEWLQRVVDAALLGVLFFAPWWMGGRGAVGRLILITLVCCAAVGWMLRQSLVASPRWRWSGAEYLLLSGASLLLLQLMPLPLAWLDRLSPAIQELLPLWRENSGTAVRLGTWSTLTLTPENTRGAVVMFLAYAMLFVVTLQRLDTANDIARLMRWVAGSMIAMAFLGAAQFLFSNGKFFWVYSHPSRDTWDAVKGTFQNENHFAHFLALGIGPLLYWLWELGSNSESKNHRQSWSGAQGGVPFRVTPQLVRSLLLVGASVVAVAGLLSYSRGGILVLTAGFVSGLILFYRAGLVDRRMAGIAAGILAVAALALMIYGHEMVLGELRSLYASTSVGELATGRLTLWRAMWAACRQFPLVGTGIGSHAEVYPIYMSEYFNIEFTHGESGYLPLLMEGGIPALALMLAGMAITFWWCFRAMRASQLEGHRDDRKRAIRYGALASAVLTSWVVSAVHSIADFVWYIPACMSVTVVLMACACRVFQLACGERVADRETAAVPPVAARRPWPAATGWACTGLVVFVSWGMITNRIPPARAAESWDAFLRLSLRAPYATPPGEAAEKLTSMQHHLERVLALNPNDARAQLRMAGVYLHQFELQRKSAANPLGLAQIRDAALASRFESRVAQDAWLNVAVGEDRQLLDAALYHVRRALHLCPLQGVGYIYHAELSFLESPRETVKGQYLQQAMRVRPYNGHVLFAVGKEASLQGDVERAIQYWRRSFRQDPEVQSLVISLLAHQMPAGVFIATFEANSAALAQLFEIYRAADRAEDASVVAEHWASRLDADAAQMPVHEAATSWHRAAAAFAWLNRLDRSLACEARAVGLAPNDWGMRRTLAVFYMENQRYHEALEHLQWCLRRSPNNSEIRQLLLDLQHRQGDLQQKLSQHTGGVEIR